MAIRLSGLSSGLDTESIIKELMSVQSMKKTKVESKLTKLEWKEEKWKELNAKIFKLYKDELSKLKTQSSYLTRSVTSSDSTKATFKANYSVPVGTHSLSISQVTSSQFVTGIEVTAKDAKGNDVEINRSTKLTSIKLSTKNDTSESGYIKSGTVLLLNVGTNKEDKFTVKDNTTISDLTTWFNKSDITFTYDTANERFFLSSMKSGSENAFTLSCNGSGILTQSVGVDYLTQAKEYLPAGSTILTDLNSAVKDYTTDEKMNILKKGNIAHNTAKKEVYVQYMNTKIKDVLGDDTDASWQYVDENWQIVPKDGVSEEIIGKLNAFNSAYSFDALMSSTKEKPADVESYQQIYANTYEVTYNNLSDETIANHNMDAVFTDMDNASKALELLGIGDIGKKGSSLEDQGVGFVEAEDMICKFNGTEYTSSSNTITINGLTINAIDVTPEGSNLKINISNDTSAVYDMIKNFVTKYNENLDEINDLYYAGAAKGYDVLTDEEREAMTDDQIEKWENRIKDSLLRRDNSLGSVRSSLRSITSKSVTIGEGEDAKVYSLSSFGINTTDYTEKGLLHIYGNSADSTVSDKTDLLRAALEEDSDTVMKVFTGIASELYSDLSEKMSYTELRSALNFYNDKEITSLKKDYKEEIDEWEEYLKDMESRYYSKFSAMETALSKLNSQTSSLSSLFGSSS